MTRNFYGNENISFARYAGFYMCGLSYNPHLTMWATSYRLLRKLSNLLVLSSSTAEKPIFTFWHIKSVKNLNFRIEYEKTSRKLGLLWQKM